MASSSHAPAVEQAPRQPGNARGDALARGGRSSLDNDRLIAASGAIIDTSGQTWRLGPETSVTWSGYSDLQPIVRDALEAHIRNQVRVNSPRYVEGQFCHLKHLAAPAVKQACLGETKTEGTVGLQTFLAFKASVADTVSPDNRDTYHGHFIRWYVWCADMALPGFDAEVAAELEAIKLKRNPQGAAVMRQDPNTGPLHMTEYQALQDRLRSPAGQALPLTHQVVTWLLLSFGLNPKSLRVMQEDDFLRTELPDGSTFYELRIPRIKKRTVGERSQFRTRSLVPEIGRMIEFLLSQNKNCQNVATPAVDRVRPLIRSATVRAGVLGTPFESDLHRAHSGEFSAILAEVAIALDLRTPAGEPLRLTPRRLRYTFATRLVQDGASPEEVADALDHSDTSHVMIYFNTRSDIVRRLDKAVGLALAPIAQAFMGTLVADERDAIRGDDEASRIRHYSPTLKTLDPVGTCGSFGFCGLHAPISCYTCQQFQPWVDGPHERVFEALEAERNARLSRGADVRMTQIHDRTMLAVAEVMLRCEQAREADA
jgi:hypothetical protein